MKYKKLFRDDLLGNWCGQILQVKTWRTPPSLWRISEWNKHHLTVVGNFPRLMKFGHFHAPKSWSPLHLLSWFFFFLSRIEWWTNWTMEEIQPIWKIAEKCHFWTLGRILSPCRCNWKNTNPMVKVVHHSILDNNKNQVNRCSRLQDLVAWKWPNFIIKRGKLPTTVKGIRNL